MTVCYMIGKYLKYPHFFFNTEKAKKVVEGTVGISWGSELLLADGDVIALHNSTRTQLGMTYPLVQ